MPWYYENFINIYLGHTNNFMYVGYDFEFVGKELFKFTEFVNETYNDNWETIPYLIEQIGSNQYYCYIWLDEYYLSCQPDYKKRHYRHVSLLYGYDEDAKVFLAYTFDKGRHFSKLQFGFDEVKSAFLMAKNISLPGDTNLILFKLKEYGPEYPFCMEKFLNQLVDYTYSHNKMKENYFELWPLHAHHTNLSYGISAYDKFTNLLAEKETLNSDDFRNLHFLYEHKLGLNKRFKYIYEILNCNELEPLIKDFKAVVNGFNMIRMLYLKHENLFYEPIENKKVISSVKGKIINYIRKYSLLEKEILEKVIITLRQFTTYNINWPDATVLANITTGHCTSEFVYFYPHSLKITYAWEKGITIEEISCYPRSFIRFFIDGKPVKSIAYNCETHRLPVDIPIEPTNGKNLGVEIYSEFPILFEEFNLRVRIVDFARGANIIASSSWKDNDPEIEKKCLPNNAIDGKDDTFWNAQKEWEKGEFLEVTFDEVTLINCILIKERPNVRRIREYSLECTDSQGNQIELIRHTGDLQNKAQIHFFEPVSVKKIKIIIYASLADEYGYSEPAISRFEAYYLPEA